MKTRHLLVYLSLPFSLWSQSPDDPSQRTSRAAGTEMEGDSADPSVAATSGTGVQLTGTATDSSGATNSGAAQPHTSKP